MRLISSSLTFGLCWVMVISILIATFPSTTYAETSSKCPGETGYIYTNDRKSENPRTGGFVSNSANVEDTVTIAPTAAVCGSASIMESARIYGTAIISDEAEVSGKARVYGNAKVSGTAQIAGNAKVSGNAKISGDAIIEGVASIRGYKKISSGHFIEGTHSAEPTIEDKKVESENRKVLKDKEEQRKTNMLNNIFRDFVTNSGDVHIAYHDYNFDYHSENWCSKCKFSLDYHYFHWRSVKASSACKFEVHLKKADIQHITAQWGTYKAKPATVLDRKVELVSGDQKITLDLSDIDPTMSDLPLKNMSTRDILNSTDFTDNWDFDYAADLGIAILPSSKEIKVILPMYTNLASSARARLVQHKEKFCTN